jgi:addiction module RelE/StbE family toxin
VKIKWLQSALDDLDHVEIYIAKDNPTAAIDTVLRIIEVVGLLSKQPGMGRSGRVLGTKELVIPATPFIVPYRVIENNVQILRVYHNSRKWPEQLE